ncbi:uncharacterized protein AMSG_10624 [Thecamonas trahens ATCC 50062]|uniref:Uncharacterized protein n=1 Tax=Thecamonas trahens ATCC 50062 TaxID=461836 RepID=A0A0L0DRV8_THETB|nr:hypothetical protein AMSG_10624 [Thecamonas trahens ATCC 50062]KNC55030.1 hypothetical protein AMSG_10624 [Thecamonas trahens ATCC 50062]|eukprot:XP_013753336.1 hypothetical protein AMSG_10624 [Thecamonas trahens ATCC 50062]
MDPAKRPPHLATRNGRSASVTGAKKRALPPLPPSSSKTRSSSTTSRSISVQANVATLALAKARSSASDLSHPNQPQTPTSPSASDGGGSLVKRQSTGSLRSPPGTPSSPLLPMLPGEHGSKANSDEELLPEPPADAPFMKAFAFETLLSGEDVLNGSDEPLPSSPVSAELPDIVPAVPGSGPAAQSDALIAIQPPPPLVFAPNGGIDDNPQPQPPGSRGALWASAPVTLPFRAAVDDLRAMAADGGYAGVLEFRKPDAARWTRGWGVARLGVLVVLDAEPAVDAPAVGAVLYVLDMAGGSGTLSIVSPEKTLINVVTSDGSPHVFLRCSGWQP